MKNVKNGVGSEPIKIRAHHLLCMQGFQGHGYSKEFAKNMAGIIEEIRQHPNSFIKVIIAADSICEHCPHHIEGLCLVEPDSDAKIRDMDSFILDKLGLEDGSLIRSSFIQSLSNCLNLQDVKRVCGNCSWRNKCMYFQKY